MALLLLILAIILTVSYLVWKIQKSMKGCKCLVEKPKETQLAETINASTATVEPIKCPLPSTPSTPTENISSQNK